MEVLWLTENDVMSLLTMDDAILAVEKAFLDQGLGLVQMPPKSYLFFPRYEGDLRTMPAYLEGQDQAGVKIVNVHNGNNKISLPTVMALLVLNSPKTGAPLSIMGATYLTSMRTGAAGAVSAKYLARASSKVVGMIGAGAQARTQLLGLSKFFNIEKVTVFDASSERTKSFIKDARIFLNCNYYPANDIKEACDCDILVTTTPSRLALVREAWVKPGTHINAIGADAKGKQELESSLTKNAKVVVDDITQAMHSGEINVPISNGVMRVEEIYAQIDEILAGTKSGRVSEKEITIFDSTGLGIQDVATGFVIYRKAVESGKGKSLPLA